MVKILDILCETFVKQKLTGARFLGKLIFLVVYLCISILDIGLFIFDPLRKRKFPSFKGLARSKHLLCC
jgi:hypothetical protein